MPDLLIVKTIVYEVIHAEMFRKLMSLTRKPNFNGFTRAELLRISRNGSFPGIYDYYRRYKKGWQHAQMATHYRQTIASILQEYGTGRPVPNGQQPAQLYMDLAWEGLNYSNIHTWSSQSPQEKARIRKVISDYIKANNSQTCQ